MIAAHSTDGRHFLGLRQGRYGGYEIIYEAVRTGRRLIWTIKNQSIAEADLEVQLRHALSTQSVLETLCSGLRSAEIEFDVDLATKSVRI
jgi:hypothetical protein